MSVCKYLLIKGYVQGVGYRASCHREARAIGELKGWVRNLDTGEVEILVQGSPQKIEKFIQWCKKGPPASHVEDVIVLERPYDPALQDFTIQR